MVSSISVSPVTPDSEATVKAAVLLSDVELFMSMIYFSESSLEVNRLTMKLSDLFFG